MTSAVTEVTSKAIENASEIATTVGTAVEKVAKAATPRSIAAAKSSGDRAIAKAATPVRRRAASPAAATRRIGGADKS